MAPTGSYWFWGAGRGQRGAWMVGLYVAAVEEGAIKAP
jgi:hypothetical protein